MMKSFKIVAASLMGLAAVACGSAEKMAELADKVTVKCNPEVLEVVAGKVDATVTVTYPDGYFLPKAVLEVTPVIVYEGGEVALTPFVYQGEKVKDNYKTISSDGQTVTERIHFDYVKGMEKSYLELRGMATLKNKSVALPSRKVADGCNTTYMLVKAAGLVPYKADNYQEVISYSQEGQILYRINSSDVAGSQLRGQSIKDFQQALDDIQANERTTLTGTEIVAYASPDGAEELNDNLADKRSASAGKAWKTIVKGHEATDPSVRGAGEDWEGFQKLVSESDIQDKELILRVLSMYSDPAVRENEIKNMSQVYTSLRETVLPALRRARFIANVEYANYTSEELLKQIEDNIDVLDEEALLRAATLVSDLDQKESIYKKAVDKYDSDRARFNLGVVALNKNEVGKAESAFKKVSVKDADVANALGVVALRKGDYSEATKKFTEAGTAEAVANQGVVDILTGNYEKAVRELADAKGCCHNTALAYILTSQLSKASEAIKCDCPKCAYLKAIIAARQGNAQGVKSNLESAVSRSEELKERSVKDIEFADFKL